MPCLDSEPFKNSHDRGVLRYHYRILYSISCRGEIRSLWLEWVKQRYIVAQIGMKPIGGHVPFALRLKIYSSPLEVAKSGNL